VGAGFRRPRWGSAAIQLQKLKLEHFDKFEPEIAMTEIKLNKGVWSYDPTTPLAPPGGFGAVYLGEDPDGNRVAVKRLHIEVAQAAHRELRIAVDLAERSFKHVLPVLDAGQDAESDAYFVVMPLAEGSLQELIEEKGQLDEGEAVEVVLQIASGLQEAAHIIHRDLKPANILYHSGEWKVADFGIARFVEESTSLRTLKECLSLTTQLPNNGDMRPLLRPPMFTPWAACSMRS
jgi:serine/threonine-protein kinase